MFDYKDDRFFYKLKETFRARLHRQRLAVKFILSPEWTKSQQYIREETFTNESPEGLIAVGYKRCKGLHDSILWSGIPVYVKIIGGTEYDTTGPEYSRDSSVTLNDAMNSNATQDFIKGMLRGAMPTMDIQKIVFIALIGIGAIIGMKIIGVF